MTKLPCTLLAGTDLLPFMENTEWDTDKRPSFILGVDSLVQRRHDGGLILWPSKPLDAKRPVVMIQENGSKGYYPGFTIYGDQS